MSERVGEDNEIGVYKEIDGIIREKVVSLVSACWRIYGYPEINRSLIEGQIIMKVRDGARSTKAFRTHLV